MNLGYSSSEDEEEQNEKQVKFQEPKTSKKLKKNPFAIQNIVKPISVNLNPDADISDKLKVKEQQELELYKQQNPEKFRDTTDNVTTGRIDKINNGNLPEQDISLAEFDMQQKNFRTFGFAYDPKKEEDEEQRLIVNEFLHPELFERQIKGEQISQQDIQDAMQKAYGLQKKVEKEITKNLKEKRHEAGNSGSLEYQGPWAKYKHEQLIQKNNLTEEEKEKIKDIEDKRKDELDEQEEKENDPKKRQERITSIFHLHDSEKRDYQGRSYLQAPSDLKRRDQTSFIPKKCVKTWKEHTKGVSCIKFFPKFGHFILSASLDGTCKLFSTTGNQKLTRTYMGHGQAVRDVCFNYNGRSFISGGYDKTINYWDTETGKIIQDIKLKAFPKSIKIHPNEANEHSFILGSSNKKIMQYDLRSGKRTQVYDEHLGGINTITFIDNNKKFVSTSDDNKMFVWEYGIPIVVKHVAEPDMQCVYATECSTNGQYMAAQQANNKIAIWDLKGGNFRMNRKKTFVGHKAAGYAIGMSFSPDGKYFCSGDSEGRAFFWDWKTNKCYKALDAHDGVCIDVAWHPIEQSKVATCGWDGIVKYWD